MPPLPSAVIFVTDVKRMTEFYRALASMSLMHEDKDHAVLQVQGFQLVIHRLRGQPHLSAEVTPVVAREDSYVKVCLPVDSIAAARSMASSMGGLIQPPRKEWEARGFRACDGHDPEGNVIQVRVDAD